MRENRDHGGGLDAAVDLYGGARLDWIDLSTGINAAPFPVPALSRDAWTALPDAHAMERLIAAARDVWKVPQDAAILAAPGASALIAQIPRLAPAGRVRIAAPTYNEHAASFKMAGWMVVPDGDADASAIVHPNNPDGRVWSARDVNTALTVIDESFCDVMPEVSLIAQARRPGTIVLKSFGKFWGLAGVRLGFAIGDPHLIERLADMLGPWPVSGAALEIGAAALADTDWADATRARLTKDAVRLDTLMTRAGARAVGGTPLFRLYEVDDASKWQARLARGQIWSRVFPYNPRWLRLGLPAPTAWDRIEAAV